MRVVEWNRMPRMIHEAQKSSFATARDPVKCAQVSVQSRTNAPAAGGLFQEAKRAPLSLYEVRCAAMADPVKPDVLAKRAPRLVAVFGVGASLSQRPHKCVPHEVAREWVKAGEARFVNRSRGIQFLQQRRKAA